MIDKSNSHSKGIVVLSNSVNTAFDQHRSTEFIERMKFFAEYFTFVHIISLSPQVSGKTIRASKTHRIYITPVKVWSIRGQMRVYYLLRSGHLILADTQLDLIHNMLAILLSRSKPILFFQGYVLEQFLISVRSSRSGKYISSVIKVLTTTLGKISLRIACCIVCVSKSMVKYVRKELSTTNHRIYYLPHSLSYAHNFIRFTPLELKKAADAYNGFIISYLGRLVESKRVHIALRTLAILLERGHNITLVIMGEGKERIRLKQLANQLGIGSKIVLMGKVDQRTALSILSMSRFMIFPSSSEGFSWSVLEALAVGCPVISYGYSSSRDDKLDRAVILVDSPCPRDFADAAEDLLLDDELHRSLVERGLEFSKPYVSMTRETRFRMFVDYITACQQTTMSPSKLAKTQQSS